MTNNIIIFFRVALQTRTVEPKRAESIVKRRKVQGVPQDSGRSLGLIININKKIVYSIRLHNCIYN